MNTKIGKVQFDGNEVDCLIRSFGMARSGDNRREIHDFLRRQKEPFLTLERERGAKTRNGPERSL